MNLIRVETDEHKSAVRHLSIEYIDILFNKFKEHYNVDFGIEDLTVVTDDWLANDFDKFIAPNGYFYLAMVDGEAVGMGGLQTIDEDTAEIKRMYVKASYRGHKLGKALLNQLLDIAKADGFSTIILDTFDFWEVAPKFYRAMGFVDTDPNPNAEPHPDLIEHCIFMKLELT